MNPHSRARFVQVQRQLAAEEPVRIDNAENQVGVSHGRTLSTEAITGGARFSPGALRPDIDISTFFHTRDRAAAGADSPHVQHGKQQVVFVRNGFLTLSRFARCDNGYVRGGAPHIERDDIFMAA